MVKNKSFIFYAPNVYTGGGLILLKSLLNNYSLKVPLKVFLDLRVANLIKLPASSHVHWVKPSIFSRLAAEWKLFLTAKKIDTVLCFSSVPPLFRNAGYVFVFHQNLILLKKSTLRFFSFIKESKFIFLRFFSYIFQSNVQEFIVQTQHMEKAVQNFYRQKTKVRTIPFLDSISLSLSSNKRENFVYIADGGEHKNHRRLLKAWSLLGKQGHKPTLLLTLGPQDKALISEVNSLCRNEGLEIYNKSQIENKEVLEIYKNSRALIFPSLLESLGLPLVEASQIGLPIIASELDYVREVCEPVETFDPESPISIMRAVLRFIGQPEPIIKIKSTNIFLEELDKVAD